MIFGEPRRDYENVSSTQDIARDWARDGGVPPGAIVTAQTMTAGRGRLGRTWIAPRGANVCFTAIGPPAPLADAWQIALVGGCAVCEALRGLLIEKYPTVARETVVRFPNDVYLNSGKVSGILVETVLPRDGRVIPLIGIGVNVCRPEMPLPPEVADRAISLNEAAGALFNVATVERAVLEYLTLCYQEWETTGFATIIARWKALVDPNMRRTFILDDRTVSCRIIDLSEEGVVLLEMPDGEQRTVSAAHVILGD